MSRRTVVRPQAIEETRRAKVWYAARAPALGDAFLDEYEAAVTRIEAQPLAYPIVHGPLRRALLHRFPYAILFRVTDAELLVVAVMHERRHPRRWLGRR